MKIDKLVLHLAHCLPNDFSDISLYSARLKALDFALNSRLGLPQEDLLHTGEVDFTSDNFKFEPEEFECDLLIATELIELHGSEWLYGALVYYSECYTYFADVERFKCSHLYSRIASRKSILRYFIDKHGLEKTMPPSDVAKIHCERCAEFCQYAYNVLASY